MKSGMGWKNYGLPYMGSKNKIAGWVVENLPDAVNFYDLFCGGCSITDYIIKEVPEKYSSIIINDITAMGEFYYDALEGKFGNRNEWISREEFLSKKDSDIFIKFCWSFGNSGRTYLYSKELEDKKRALHYVVVNDKWDEFIEVFGEEKCNECKELLKDITGIRERR